MVSFNTIAGFGSEEQCLLRFSFGKFTESKNSQSCLYGVPLKSVMDALLGL